MPVSLYQASLPAFVRGLNNLKAVLEKAEVHAAAGGVELSTYVNARLSPDMLTLAGQVQSASDAAKFGAARLAKMQPPSFADTETTYEELLARIEITLAFLATVKEADVNASEGGTITLKLGGKESTFNSEPYLLDFVLPNFYFHVTTAYDILRNQGVPLVKMDFLGAFQA